MANPAVPDPSSPVPCKRCAALLQAGERFCPFCGEPQTAPAAGTRAAGDAPAATDIDFADTVQPESVEEIDKAVAAHAAADAVDPQIGLVRPGAFWQKETSSGSGSGIWAGSFAVPKRLLIGILVALIVVSLALLFGRTRLEAQDDGGRLQDVGTQVEQAQGALNRGDLGRAAQLLEALDAGHADDPGVQALKTTLEQRLQERVRRQQLLDAALKASRALRLDEPPGPTAPAPVPPPPVPPTTTAAAPSTVAPAPALGLAAPDDKECSEALAALALCARK